MRQLAPAAYVAFVAALSLSTSSHADLIFGSYGRVGVGTNLDGRSGQTIEVTRHGPRIEERPYAEIDFAYHSRSSAEFETHLTLGLGESLFHSDGTFDSSIAVRNLYLEWKDFGRQGLDIWAGSRMYRGDDIYLLDFWPLDEQNTLGAGVTYARNGHETRVHIGVHRLNDPFQIQTIQVPDLEYGTRDVAFMERQRGIATLRHQALHDVSDTVGFKWVAYTEAHGLPKGVFREDDLDTINLPSDWGILAGAELSVFKKDSSNYFNIFLKYATGLATVDELEVPTKASLQERTAGSHEYLVGTSANYERGDWAILLGSYARYYLDADDNVYDFDDRFEVATAIRPTYYLSDNVHLLTEASLQVLRPNGISPVTQEHDVPMAFQVAFMPTLAAAKGSYARPHLRLIVATTFQNDDAKALFAEEDPRSQHSRHDYVGLLAEWWFNSSRYQ